MHLTVEHYLLALRDELPIEALAHQSSLHLSEVCPFCSAEADHSRHVLSPTLDNGSRESPSFDPRCISRRVVTAAKGLTEYQDLYLNEDDDYKKAFFVLLSGRVALANGRLDEAGSLLVDARDRLLALDRDYDAILTALYLAGALLAAGKTSELKRLAVGLVPLFRARDVERETLAALCLLAQAAKAEGVTAAVLAEVRDKLCSPPRASARVPRL